MSQRILASVLVTALCAVVDPGIASTAPSATPFDRGMQPILSRYLAIHDALAADSTKGVRAAARAIVRSTAKLNPDLVSGDSAKDYRRLPRELRAAARALAKAETLEQARWAFDQLSRPMTRWIALTKPAGIRVAYCSKARASWLQKGMVVRNPYYGTTMLRCGRIVGGAGYIEPCVEVEPDQPDQYEQCE